MGKTRPVKAQLVGMPTTRSIVELNDLFICDTLAADRKARARFFELLLQNIGDPGRGLPDEVFEFALAITPMINVDLLVSGDRGVLLAWREDKWGSGWHVPGGIIRFNETISHRISEVARLELETSVVADMTPIALSQFFASRGHFISLLYRCVLTAESAQPMAVNSAMPRNGELAWCRVPPADIYPAHLDYIPRLAEFGQGHALTLAEPPKTLG
jgi:ADP-ribose pyrophosphatase YjhB (NUDIX family)